MRTPFSMWVIVKLSIFDEFFYKCEKEEFWYFTSVSQMKPKVSIAAFLILTFLESQFFDKLATISVH
jgi:hypothetical protein